MTHRCVAIYIIQDDLYGHGIIPFFVQPVLAPLEPSKTLGTFARYDFRITQKYTQAHVPCLSNLIIHCQWCQSVDNTKSNSSWVMLETLVICFLWFLTILTIIGNAVTIVTILARKKTRNCHGNRFLLSLSAADLSVGLFVMMPAVHPITADNTAPVDIPLLLL